MIPGIKNIQALIITVIIFVSGIAQAQTWQQVPLRTKAQQTAGLAGGEGMQQIFGMAYAPSNPNTVYIITDTAQIWKSTDGGTTWGIKNNGFKSNGGFSLTVSPTDENVVLATGCPMIAGGVQSQSYASMGIWRTIDGGSNWTLVKSTYYDSSSYGSNPIAFVNSTTAYAGLYQSGLWKSTDTGATWSQVNLSALNGDKIIGVYAHPDDSSVIFVSSATDNAFYKVTGNGTSITQIGTGLSYRPIALQIKGNNNGNANDDLIYVGVGGYGVYKSTNSGSNFSAINNGLPASKDVAFLAMSQADSNYLYATSMNNTWIYYSHNGGTNWYPAVSTDVQNADGWVAGSQEGANSDMGVDYYSSYVIAHPTNRDISLVSGSSQIVKKTTDGGLNWRYSMTGRTGGATAPNGSGSSVLPMSFDKNNSNRYVIFLADFGPFLTEDNGSLFRNLRVPAHSGYVTTLTGSISPTQPNTIISAVGEWYSNQVVIITRDANSTNPAWTKITGTEDYYLFISFHPTNGNVAYAGRYKFTNLQTNNNYTTLSKKVHAMYPGNGDIVYSISAPTSGTTRIWKSTDGGSTWTNPYPDVSYPVGNVGGISISPNNPDKIYIPVLFNGMVILTTSGYTLKNDAHGLIKSDLGWYNIDIVSSAVDVLNPDIVYAGYWRGDAGSSMGIFRSLDGGNTWTNINGNLGSNISCNTISVSPYTGYCYFGSAHGTWKLPPPYGVSEPSWSLQYVDSEELVGENGAAVNAFDGNVNTMWVTQWYGTSSSQPHEIQINLGEVKNIGGFKYLPRQDGNENGRIGQYEFYVSTDGSSWGTAVGTGTFANDATEKTVTFGTQSAKQYIRLKSLSEVNGNPWTTMAEISLITGEAASESVSAPLVITSPASNITYTTATLNGQVNPSGLQSTYRWQYGTSPSSYSFATGSQTVATGTAYVNVSDNITSLLPGTTYYMRCQANNGSGTTNGSQTSFTTITNPQLSYDATKTGTNTITVDGLLTDWPALTNSISKTISGSPLSTGTGSALWNDQYLYVAVSVSDSILYDTGSTNTPYVKDGIDIYIDRDHNQGSTYDGYDLHLSRSYNNSYIWSSGTNTGILAGGSYTANTYNVEMAIPWAIFPGAIVPGSGTTIGFDFQINDNNGTDGVRLGAKGWNNSEDTNYFNPQGFGDLVLLGEQATPPPPIGTNTSILTWYKLNDSGSTATDSIVGNNATLTGATWTSGILGGALSLDGIDDYAATSNLSLGLNGTNAVSLAGWINYTVAGNKRLISKAISDGWNTFYLQMNPSGKIQFSVENSTLGQYPQWESTTAIATSTTTHIAVAFGKNAINATDVSMWFNGEPINTTYTAQNYASDFVVQEASEKIVIGARPFTYTMNFNGFIDDLRIYSGKIGTQTVLDLVTIGSCTVGVGTPTTITQTSATLMGTVTPNGSSTFNGYFRIGTQTGNYGFGTTTEQYIGSGTTGVTLSKNVSGLSQGTTYYYVPVAYNGAGIHKVGSQSSFTTLEIDSVSPIGTITINSSGTYTTAREVILNLSATDAIGVTGYFVSENADTPYGTQTGWVSIVPSTAYSEDIQYTLTTTDETKTVYVWYKDGAGNISGVVSDAIILDTTFPNISILSPVSNCWMSDGIKAFGTTGSTIFIAGSSTDTNGIGTVTIGNSATTTTRIATGTQSYSSSERILSTLDDGLVFRANLDEPNGTNVIKDTSRYGITGTNSGAVGTDTSKYGRARYFDGVDDYVNFGDSGNIELGTKTISFWGKFPAQTGDRTILSFRGVSSDYEGLTITSNGKILLRLANENYRYYNSGDYLNNQWNHYAIVITGTQTTNINNASLYFNGQTVTVYSTSASVAPLTWTDICIGRNNYGLIRGYIDEVRIYNRVLSQAEVTQLYQLTTPDILNTISATAYDTPSNQGTSTIHVGAFPAVSTTDATTIARNSAMLNGSCSANLNTSTVWFEYGIVSGTYIGSSTTTQLTGDTETAVNISLGALNKNTEYFYRLRGSNAIGETYGEEFSFTTLAGYTLEEVTGINKPLSWSLLETTKFLHGLRNYGIYNWKTTWRSTQDRQDLIDNPDEEITEALEDL